MPYGLYTLNSGFLRPLRIQKNTISYYFIDLKAQQKFQSFLQKTLNGM